jgi:hypothetical protein
LLCLLLLALAACSKPTFPPDPLVRRTAQSVDGFNFKTVGQSLMGTNYLTWTSYSFFTYRGETWYLEGDQTATARQGVRASGYEVEEREIEGAVPQRTHLTVRDLSTGEVIAERDIVRSWTWTGRHWQVGGWEGDEARKWLTSVLVPTESKLSSALRPNDAALAKLELAPQQISLPSDSNELLAFNQNVGCPVGTGAIRRSPPVPVLQGSGWWYRPELPLQRVLCGNDHYLALSHIYGNQTVVDLLDKDGRVMFRTHLHAPVSMDSRVVALRNPKLNQSALQFDMAYAVAENGPHSNRFRPGATYHVTIEPPSEVRPGDTSNGF